MKKLILSIVFMLLASSLFAQNAPTVGEIYRTVEHGDLTRASRMIQVVLREHPNSAKAHYVDAEILVKEGRLEQARKEFQAAKSISPRLSFVSASSVRELEGALYENNNHAMPIKSSHFPVMTVILLIIAILFIFFIIRSYRKKRNMVQNPYANNNTSANNSNNGGYQNTRSGFGGMASGLASGLAAGAGFAAGEELFDHFTHDDNRDVSADDSSLQDSSDDQSLDSDFGISDDSSWGDDSSGDFGGDDSW